MNDITKELADALRNMCRFFPTDHDMAQARMEQEFVDLACNAYDAARSALDRYGSQSSAQGHPADPVYDRSVVARIATQMGWTPPAAQQAEAVMLNGLTEAETLATASVAGLTKGPAEAAQRDAERYRWLKRNPQWLGWEHDFRPDEVEREIDAAMQSDPQVTGIVGDKP